MTKGRRPTEHADRQPGSQRRDEPLLVPSTDGVPVPVPSLTAGPYWEGCRQGELRFQRCERCGTIPPMPVSACPGCHGAAPAWARASGAGRLYSWTVVWRPQHPAFQVPYAPAIVTLTEGARVLSAVVGCRPSDVRAEMALTVEFHCLSDEITLPFFRPANR